MKQQRESVEPRNCRCCNCGIVRTPIVRECLCGRTGWRPTTEPATLTYLTYNPVSKRDLPGQGRLF